MLEFDPERLPFTVFDRFAVLSYNSILNAYHLRYSIGLGFSLRISLTGVRTVPATMWSENFAVLGSDFRDDLRLRERFLRF